MEPATIIWVVFGAIAGLVVLISLIVAFFKVPEFRRWVLNLANWLIFKRGNETNKSNKPARKRK